MVLQLGKLFCLSMLCFISTLQAFPTRIIVIRHGEKPTGTIPKVLLADPHPYYSQGLTSEGQMRASYLVGYFLGIPQTMPPLFLDMVSQNGNPAINPITFIAAYSTKDEEGSFRPVETITPLANALFPNGAATLVTEYDPKNVTTYTDKTINTTMKTDIAEQTGTVVVCWKHGKIPKLILDLNVPETNPTYVQIFPKGKYPNPAPFNLTFIITYDTKNPWQVTDFSVQKQIPSF